MTRFSTLLIGFVTGALLIVAADAALAHYYAEQADHPYARSETYSAKPEPDRWVVQGDRLRDRPSGQGGSLGPRRELR